MIGHLLDSFRLLSDDLLVRFEDTDEIDLDNRLMELVDEYFEALQSLALIGPYVGAIHFFFLTQSLSIEREYLLEKNEFFFANGALLVVFFKVFNHAYALKD